MKLHLPSIALSLALLAGARAAERPQPNIVLILADDLGWSDVGFQGAKLNATPVLDQLAREGVVFSQFYATPTCAPSRAVLLTGQYGPRHGNYSVDAFAGTPPALKRVVGERSTMRLKATTRTLADILRAAGYDTALIGKWHLGAGEGNRAEDHGFAVNIGGGNAGHTESYFAPYGGEIPLTPKKPGEYLTDRLTDEALDFIGRARAKPFFLYYASYAVHVPLHAREKFMPPASGEPASNDPVPPYVAMVRHLDYSIGRLIEALQALPKDRETIVVFASDNGGQLIDTSNLPLRGQKGTVYEGGIRVPAIFWAPGRIPAGRTTATPAALQDLLPTCAAWAGAPLPAQPVDGLDLAPALRGEPLAREALFWHLPNYTGNLKTNARVWQPPVSVIRRGDWKLIEHLDEPKVELYNLVRDLGEQQDCAATEPVLVQSLTAQLHAWQRAVNAPRPTEPNPRFDAAAAADLGRANRRDPDEWRRSVKILP